MKYSDRDAFVQDLCNFLDICEAKIITYKMIENYMNVERIRSSIYYPKLVRARNKLRKYGNIIFETVRGEGLRRLQNDEKIGQMQHYRDCKTRAIVKHNRGVAKTIDVSKLSEDSKAEYYKEITLSRFLSETRKSEIQLSLLDFTNKKQNQLSPAEMAIAVFQSRT